MEFEYVRSLNIYVCALCALLFDNKKYECDWGLKINFKSIDGIISRIKIGMLLMMQDNSSHEIRESILGQWVESCDGTSIFVLKNYIF